MRAWLDWLLTINSPDKDIQRRGRNTIFVILGAFVLIFFTLISRLIAGQANILIISVTVIPIFIYLGLLVMIRRGYVTLSAAIITSIMIVSLGVVISREQMQIALINSLLLPLLFASISLRSWHLWIVYTAITIALISALYIQNAATNTPIFTSSIGFDILLFAVFTLILFLGTHSLERSVAEANDLRHIAESSSQEIARVNDSLEQTVQRRTADLQQALGDVQERETRLTTTLAELSSSQDTIRELSAPVMPILSGVILAPLIGLLDQQRTDLIMQNILTRIRSQNTRYLILDVTGVPLIDTQVANMLIQTARAAELLGTATLLVGVRPEVAQTLVALNIDFGSIQVFADLQEAVLSLMPQRSSVSARLAHAR